MGRSMKDVAVCKLEQQGFRVIGVGGFKTVLRSKNYPQYVIKVYNCCGDWEFDSNIKNIPPTLDKFILRPICWNMRYMIQYYLPSKNSNNAAKMIERALGEGCKSMLDIYSRNCRMYEGKPVLIDFCC